MAVIVSADLLHDFRRLVHVQFGVGLRDRQRIVTQHSGRAVKAELLPDFCRIGVPELMREPGRYSCLFAGTFDSLAISSGSVSVAWASLPRLLPAVQLAGLDLALAIEPTLGVPFRLALGGREEEFRYIRHQAALDDFNCLGPQEDDAGVPQMSGLVFPLGALIAARPVLPDVAGGIQVDGPHLYQLARSHSGELLKADHVASHRGKEGQSSRDDFGGDGADSGGLPRS